MYSELRNSDEQGAGIVNQFLYDNFYRHAVKNYRLETGMTGQFAGIDLEFDYNGVHYICDEKSDIQYQGNQLNTFCLELSYICRGGYRRWGWFLDKSPDYRTNAYMFIWIGSVVNTPVTRASDINDVEICLVRKQVLQDYCASIGYSDDKLRETANMMVDTMRENLDAPDGCRFHYSIGWKLVEQPVMLLVPKTVYRKLADANYTVKRIPQM